MVEVTSGYSPSEGNPDRKISNLHKGGGYALNMEVK